MTTIAHISDLHFGACDMNALQSLYEAIEAAAPNAIVATGDITQAGRRSEFRAAASYLARFSKPLLIIAGNHDVPVFNAWLRFTDPWRRFQRHLLRDAEATLDVPGARIVGLNSARRSGLNTDWSLGRLSIAQIERAAAAAQSSPESALRVIALHHPVRATEGRAGRAVVGRAPNALTFFGGAGVDLILTGHTHISSAATIDGNQRKMVLAAAGTASSTRERGETPSFNLIDGNSERISVSMFNFRSLFRSVQREANFVKTDGGWQSE